MNLILHYVCYKVRKQATSGLYSVFYLALFLATQTPRVWNVYLAVFVCLCVCSRLPGWVQSMIPRIFYITEKAWNYYPYTYTGQHVL